MLETLNCFPGARFHTRARLRGHAEDQTLFQWAKGACGTVDYSRVVSSPDLVGSRIRCLSGYLWVTVQGEGEDHILGPGQSLAIGTPGKVIIGGKGAYCL
jgi:hypothetical protein